MLKEKVENEYETFRKREKRREREKVNLSDKLFFKQNVKIFQKMMMMMVSDNTNSNK